MAQKSNDYYFLEGGGEMGSLIRSHDWPATSIGPIDQWPLSLRTLLAMMLTSRFPMLIFWGKDLITFYNDAFRPSLGNEGKHPSSLGQRGEESWAESWFTIGPMIYNIMAGGDAVWFEDQKLPIYRNGKMDYAYWTYSFSPLRNDEGEVGGLLVTCSETTKGVESLQALQEAEQSIRAERERFQNLLRDANFGVVVLSGEHMITTVVNSAYARMIGHTVESLLNRPIFEAIPDAEAYFRPIIDQVRTTGEPYFLNGAPYKVYGEDGQPLEGFINIVYQPYREADGRITGVMIAVYDVTEQVGANQKVEEARRQLLSLFEQSPVAIATISRNNLVFNMVNPFYAELVGRQPEDLVGKPLLEALPELKGQGFDDLLRKVVETGEPFLSDEVPADLIRGGVTERIYVNLAYQPMREADNSVSGILVVATDITPQVESLKIIESSEARFRTLIEEAPFAIALYAGEELVIEITNEVMIKLWGKTPQVIGMKLIEALPELEGQPFIGLLQEVMRTGIPYHTTEQPADLVVDGKLQRFWFNFTYKPIRDANGKVTSILNMAVDITAQVKSRQAIEEAEAKLSAAIDTAELATWNIDLTTNEVTYSSRLQDWLGLTHSTLLTGGSPRVHEKDRQRILEAINTAISPGGNGTLDETYTVVNLETGRQRIIHTVGKTSLDNGGKAISLSGTAQDVTLQQQVQLALEAEVAAQTSRLTQSVKDLAQANEALTESNRQLVRSNEELAQYAYVASHDLQEPLRKIRLFSGMLLSGEQSLTARKATAEKIQRSTERMSLLIRDLLEFSRLLKSDALLQPVNLQSIVEEIVDDFELVIGEKEAEVRVGDLPVIEGISLQMNQLFYNLVGNALKFASRERKPLVEVSARTASREEVETHIDNPFPGITYYRVTVQDNGIGFDPMFLDQIFEVFKRLHGRTEYSGSGIGLAICRRVAQNHKGNIFAESAPDEGASFHVLLPETQPNTPVEGITV